MKIFATENKHSSSFRRKANDVGEKVLSGGHQVEGDVEQGRRPDGHVEAFLERVHDGHVGIADVRL
jgi:hypothetical protein